MSEPRLLVFGATGYTGRYLVRDACQRGLSVVAHIRPGSPRAASVGAGLVRDGAELAEVGWTAADIRALVARVTPTHVFALLGITRAGARKEAKRTGVEPTYAQVDTGYTNWILDAVASEAPEARVTYLSSLGAERASSNAYLQARHVVEQRLQASALDFTIVRPSFISGQDRDERRPAERVGSVLSNAALSVVGVLGARTLQQRYATVSGEALGRMLVTAALEPTLSRQAVDMVSLRGL